MRIFTLCKYQDSQYFCHSNYSHEIKKLKLLWRFSPPYELKTLYA